MKALDVDFYKELQNYYEEIVSWRRYLHQNPELSFEESETPKFIAEKLRSFGLMYENELEEMVLLESLKVATQGRRLLFEQILMHYRFMMKKVCSISQQLMELCTLVVMMVTHRAY